MAFTSAVTRATVVGDQRLIFGTFTQVAGDVGGSITTGLNLVNDFDYGFSSHVGATEPKVTVSGGTVTMVTVDGVSGTWSALGR